MQCATHPDIETNLSCGKCGEPICPKCLVQTPVGSRCRKCANIRKLPVFDVPKTFYIRALAAGLVSAGILGAIWHYIPSGGWFLFLIAAGVGYGIGEIISLSVNRKRGRLLQAIAAVSVIVSYMVKSVILAPNTGFNDALLDLSYGLPFGIFALAIGIMVAIARLR